jgi:hypothetical protein
MTPKMELTGRGDYIQLSNQLIKLKNIDPRSGAMSCWARRINRVWLFGDQHANMG